MITNQQLYDEYLRIRPYHNSDIEAHHVLAQKYNQSSVHVVRGRIGKVRRAMPPAHEKRIHTITPEVIHIDPLPSLESLSDVLLWDRLRTQLLHDQPFVTVMHPCDRHEPFSHKGANELWYKLASLVQPDVVVRGSDEEDNPTISFWADGGNDYGEERISDFLDSMYCSRLYHTRRTALATPQSIQINIEGNHGWPRFEKWVSKDGKASRDTLTRRYIENVRSGGGTLWIGNKQSVRLLDLVVMHGKKYGVHAAKQTLDMRSSSVDIMAGHSHRPQMYSTVGMTARTAVISGCLCLLNPHYNDDEEDRFSLWQHSTVVATLNTRTGETDFKEVRFHTTGSLQWFEWGGSIYTYEEKAEGKPAAA